MKKMRKVFRRDEGRKNTADAGRKRLKSGERNKNNEKRGTSDSSIGALGYGIYISLSGYGDLLQSYKKLDNNQFRKSEV